MKKYNNYKAYYETHKEQEKARTLAYYKEHREEILARRRAKRDAEPKKVRLTPVDYQEMWECLKIYTKDMGFDGFFSYMERLEKTQLIFKEYNKQEAMKNEIVAH